MSCPVSWRSAPAYRVAILAAFSVLAVGQSACSAASEKKYEAGYTFNACKDGVCPEMVVVLPGSFTMGSPASDVDSADTERPQHSVAIGKPFAVGKYEVTFAEWDACVAAGGCDGYRPDDAGWGRETRPAVNVSWDDIQAYLSWLNAKTGQTYRLLSEAEWEYAARAGTTTIYIWGDEAGTNQANCKNCGSEWSARQTAPVGSFPANAFGVYDMNGNVWEWLADCWNDSYENAPTDGSAWLTGNCDRHAMRGGAWNHPAKFLRSGRRYWNNSDTRYYDNGFRIARTLD